MTADFRNSADCFREFQRGSYPDEGFRMFQNLAAFLRWAGNSEDHGDREDG